jgi:opacity protein-like surface antigen
LKRERPAGWRCSLGFIAGAVLHLAVGSSPAQEALTTAVAGDQAYRARSASDYLPSAQLRAGPVNFNVGLHYELEWNDNIRYASSNLESDFIHRPQMDVRATWAATKDSVLSFGTGIGYQTYMNHSDLDRMLITPNSELAWDIPVEDFVFTLYDRFLYSQDVASQASLSGTAQFPRLENTIGIRVRWSPEKYQFELGYAHYNFISEGATFDYLGRASEQFFGRAAYRVAEKTLVGLEVSGSLTDYETTPQRNNQSVSVGPYVEWQLLADLRLGLRGGYVTYFQVPDLALGQGGTTGSYYFGLEADHQLTEHVTHRLSVTQEVQQSLNAGSGFLEQLSIHYSVTWAFLRNASFSTDFFYENGNTPQPGINPQSSINEKFDRLGFGAGMNWQLLRHLAVGMAYRYTTRDSNLPARGYHQNLATLSGNYQF